MTLSEVDQYLNKIRSDPNFKGAVGRSLTRILYANHINSQDRRFTICKEIVMTIPAVIYTPKDFYLMDSLNERIQMLKAAGLIDFWHFQDIDRQISIYEDLEYRKTLTLAQLLGSFQILGIGLGLCFVVFVIELLCHKVTDINQR